MRRRASRAVLMSMMVAPSLLLASCAQPQKKPPFIVTVNGSGASCSFEVSGRQVSADELLVIAQNEAAQKHEAHVLTGRGDPPYRCIGGVIYTLQRAGMMKIGFISEPPEPAKP